MKIVDLQDRGLKLCILNRKDPSDYDYIKRRASEFFEILEAIYKPLGGCPIYESVKKMLQMAARYKVIVDSKENIYAVATYRHFKDKGSFKCILMGRNHHMDASIGKIGIQWIIKSDIINWKKLYWVEAWGPVAHWLEKYKAMRILAVYAPGIVGTENIILDDEDEYKYYKQIKNIHELKPKYLFGFDSQETIKKLMCQDEYDNYELTIRRLYGKVNPAIYESNKNLQERLDAVLQTWYYIDDSYTDCWAFRNMTLKTKNIIESLCKEGQMLCESGMIKENTKEELEYMIEICQSIIEDACILVPHKMFGNE